LSGVLSLPPLPRLSAPENVVPWSQNLVNALEQQFRRNAAPQAYVALSHDLNVRATGTNLATAYPIKAQFTHVGTSPGGSVGLVLPTQPLGTFGYIVNTALNSFTLYAPAGATVNGFGTIPISTGSVQVWFVTAPGVYFVQV
jgi:hypothetical protein